MEDDTREGKSLREYLAVLAAHKGTVVASVLVIVALAIVFSLQQSTLYAASAEVYLNFNSEVAQVSDSQSAQSSNDEEADRLTTTYAQLAESGALARRTLVASGDHSQSPDSFLKASSVTAGVNSNFLVFTVRNADSRRASRLADQYARQFTIYATDIQNASIASAVREVENSMSSLGAAKSGSLYQGLASKLQQLKTLAALQTSTATVVPLGRPASRVQPSPARNVVFGLILGLIVGIAAALVRDALDTRVSDPDEIGQVLGLVELARLPGPPNNAQGRDQLVMLSDPEGLAAEAIRMLRTGLEFTTLAREIRSMTVISAVPSEGKSTTTSNLAIALARTGKRVIVADLDFRAPRIHALFDIKPSPGVSDVVVGNALIDDALISVPVADEHGVDGLGDGGRLEVLACGSRPPNIGEFVRTAGVARLLQELSSRADIVLVDTPPILSFGDAVTISSEVDAVLVVVKLDLARRPILADLSRKLTLLSSKPAGYALTGTRPPGQYYGSRYYATADSIMTRQASGAIEHK